MKEIIKKVIQIIFQKNTPKSILLDPEIHQLTPFDVLKLNWKEYKEKNCNEEYFTFQSTNYRFLLFLKLMVYLSIKQSIYALKGNLVSVPLNLCINQTAFSYGNQGWHWVKDLATEVMLKPDISMEETRFYKFFHIIQCSSYTQSMTFFDVSLMNSLPEIPFGSFPWGHFDREIDIDPFEFHDTTKDHFLWFDSGPGINEALRKEFDKTVTLLTSIKMNGYKSIFSKFQFPSVVILKNMVGNVRFLNVDGAHRFAVLSALEYDRVVVRLVPDRCPPILEEDIERWPYVQSGLINKTDATRLFQMYFTLDGSERAFIAKDSVIFARSEQ